MINLLFPEAQGFPNFINIAHKNGLQVELRGSFGGGMANDYENLKPMRLPML